VVAVVALGAAAALGGARLARSTGDGGPATTLPYRLDRATHRPGDCLTWDQGAGPADTSRPVATVACDEPHLVEVTGRVVVTAAIDHPPSDDELDTLTDRLCLPVDEARLGGPLDAHGRYYHAGIQPSAEGWRAGDREVWCALAARDGTGGRERDGDRGPAVHALFRGPVSAAAQFWHYDTGACLAAGRRAPVDCMADHEVEIVGRVVLPDRSSVPALDDARGWEALVGPACADQARAYLGGRAARPVVSGWLGIGASSWAAGDRSAHCVVGQRDPTRAGWVTVRRPARG
jgi:hypothetical protein